MNGIATQSPWRGWEEGLIFSSQQRYLPRYRAGPISSRRKNSVTSGQARSAK